MRRTSTNLRAPFLGPVAPVYPTLRQILRVAAPAGAVYTGFVQQFDGSKLRDREQVYVFEPNGIALAPGKVKARLVGAYTGIAGTLPLFVTGQACCVGRGAFSSSSLGSPSAASVASSLLASSAAPASSPAASSPAASAASGASVASALPSSITPASSRAAALSSSLSSSSVSPSSKSPSSLPPISSVLPSPTPGLSISSSSASPSSSSSACPCVIRGWTSAFGTSAAPGVPAGTATGDVMLAFITAETSITDGNGIGGRFVPAVGWKQEVQGPVLTYAVGKTARGFLYSKVAGANETPATWGDGLQISVVCGSFGNAGNPAASQFQFTGAPPPQAPSVTAPAGGMLFCSFHETGATAISPPSGMTDSGQGTVGNFGVEASFLQPVSGATGVKNGSGGTGQMAGISIVLPCCTTATAPVASPSSSSAGAASMAPSSAVSAAPSSPKVASSISGAPSAAPSAASSSTSPAAPGLATTCCANLLPATIHATFSNALGTCSCLAGVVVVMQGSVNGSTTTWSGTMPAVCGCGSLPFGLLCSNGVWSFLTGGAGACTLSNNPASGPTVSCSPFSVSWSNAQVINTGYCPTGSFTVTFTL